MRDFVISVWAMKSQNNVKNPRLYVSSRIKKGQEIVLDLQQFHYLRDVLRQEEGSEIRIFNGQDGEWSSVFHVRNKKSSSLEPQVLIVRQNHIAKRIHLLFPPIKKNRLDFMIEKSVELGVTDLHPILTQNTDVRKINQQRLDAQIIEASEQSERLNLPILHSIETLEKKCLSWNVKVPIFSAIERYDCDTIKNIKSNIDIAFMVGPEGGFTKQEVLFLTSCSYVTPVSLGARILRVETAALYGLVALSE